MSLCAHKSAPIDGHWEMKPHLSFDLHPSKQPLLPRRHLRPSVVIFAWTSSSREVRTRDSSSTRRYAGGRACFVIGNSYAHVLQAHLFWPVSVDIMRQFAHVGQKTSNIPEAWSKTKSLAEEREERGRARIALLLAVLVLQHIKTLYIFDIIHAFIAEHTNYTGRNMVIYKAFCEYMYKLTRA